MRKFLKITVIVFFILVIAFIYPFPLKKKVSFLLVSDSHELLSDLKKIKAYDTTDLYRYLKTHPLIDKFYVKRLFLGKKQIFIYEKKKFFIWRNDESYYLISDTGSIIRKIKVYNKYDLPIVHSSIFPDDFFSLYSVLQKHPLIHRNVFFFHKDDDGWWDITFYNAMKIYLPHIRTRYLSKSLEKLEEYDNRLHILSLPIKSINLRGKDKTIIRLDEKDIALIDKKKKKL